MGHSSAATLKRSGPAAPSTGQEWARAGVSVLPWLAPAAACIVLKFNLLVSHTKWGEGGFDLLGRYLGIQQFTGYQRLAFFRQEILLVLVLVPAGMVLAQRWLPAHARALVAGFFSAAVFTVLFAERLAINAVGTFISLDLFWPAYLWGRQEAAARRDYLPASAIAQYAGGIALIVLLAWWGARQQRRLARGEARHVPRALLAAAIYLPLITAALWLIPIPASPMQTPVLLTITRTLWAGAEVDTREFRGLSAAQLRTRYQELASVPPPLPTEYFGKARGYNVLYFIMETAPARCLALDSEPAAYPNLVFLRRHAFLATAHHATFLHTHANLFSIFTSWYPYTLGSTDVPAGRNVPGVVRELVASGYDGGVYSPLRSEYAITDEPMFATVGFPRVRYPTASPNEVMARLRLDDKLADDQAALQVLKADVRRWTSSNQRFVAAFLPQIGHAPWPDLRTGGRETDVLRRGRNIVSLQDQWIGELIAVLRESGALEHTLIIVTGDHGVRTHIEDPALREGILDDYSYHVPLLIYAPGVLSQTETIDWVTSHVDIAPAIADLLGLTSGRQSEQGTAIWNPELAARTTYLFGRSYAGADGFYRVGRFYMRNYLSGQSYSASQLHFEAQDVIRANSPVEAEVTAALARMTALQQIWLSRFAY